MISTEDLTEQEIFKHIACIENEIDICLEYDLPIQHLESELNALEKVLCCQTLHTGIHGLWDIACGIIITWLRY